LLLSFRKAFPVRVFSVGTLSTSYAGLAALASGWQLRARNVEEEKPDEDLYIQEKTLHASRELKPMNKPNTCQSVKRS
jgi:hypothetical protein